MGYVNTIVLFLAWFRVIEFSTIRGDITSTHFLIDPETLESSAAIFKFGFFSPINSTNRYVGIWYNKELADNNLEVVWVANKGNPLNDSSGLIKISEDGNLQLLDGKNKSIWSSNITANNEVNVARILDTGNLVLQSNASGNVMWQSFDHPTDSLLLHMVLKSDGNTSVNPMLASWNSPSNLSNGHFTAGIYRRNLSEFFIWNGDRPSWRSGPWDGRMFMGVKAMFYSAQDAGFSLQNDNEGTIRLSYSSASQRVTEHYVLTYDGMLIRKDWEDDEGDWTVQWQSLQYECDRHGKCGEFGSCNSNMSPICSCLRGFEPRNNQEWSAGNWTNGCVRRTPLQCEVIGGKENGFLRISNVKVPDNAAWSDSDDEEDCSKQCLGNCSCLAYAYNLGFGCMIWSGSLIDIQDFSPVGVDVMIRLAHSELGDRLKRHSHFSASRFFFFLACNTCF